jgi:hypothetical protein
MSISKKKRATSESRRVVAKAPIKDVLEKQMLFDLEKKLSLNVGSFLVLTEEGDPTQIALAHQKAKTDFLKFAPEMHRIAELLGGDILFSVSEYLDSVDTVLHTAGFLDEEKIAQCFHKTQKLEATLKQ